MAPERTRSAPEPTLRLIILYKFVRGALACAAAIVLAGFAVTHRTGPLLAAAGALRRHVTGAWAIAFADAVVSAVTPRHVVWAAVALALDGMFTLLEGWSLRRGFWWAPWLVVIASAVFLPFEVAALVRRATLDRALLLLVNVAVAAYLARRALHEQGRR